MPHTLNPAVPVDVYAARYVAYVLRYASGSSARILEIGADEGDVTRQLPATGQIAIGLDRDLDALAKHRGPPVVCSDAAQLPFDGASFDVVAMFDVIEHLASPFSALVEMHRVLVGGGHLLLTTPNLVGLDRWLRPSSWSGVADPTHRYLFSPSAISHLLTNVGFAVEEVATPFHRLGWMPALAQALLERSLLGGQLRVAALRRTG